MRISDAYGISRMRTGYPRMALDLNMGARTAYGRPTCVWDKADLKKKKCC